MRFKSMKNQWHFVSPPIKSAKTIHLAETELSEMLMNEKIFHHHNSQDLINCYLEVLFSYLEW